MENNQRITVSLAPQIREKLDQLCAEKGVKRPAIISMAIDSMWKEVNQERGEK